MKIEDNAHIYSIDIIVKLTTNTFSTVFCKLIASVNKMGFLTSIGIDDRI